MIPKHIIEMFALFSDACPNWPISERTIRTWASMLVDLDPDALLRAAREHCMTEDYPPSISSIRSKAMANGGKGAEEAWCEVSAAIVKHGWSWRPEWTSPRIGRAVDAIGGWRSLCSTATTQMPVQRAHFMRIYAGAEKSERLTAARALISDRRPTAYGSGPVSLAQIAAIPLTSRMTGR